MKGWQALIIVVVIWGAGLFGWGLNVYKLTQADFEAPYKTEVIRVIGLTPVGAILGYLDIGEENDSE